MRMKYVITKQRDILLFSEWINHSSVHMAINVKSAGFVDLQILGGKVEARCFGESVSLGFIKSNPVEDNKLISDWLNDNVRD